MLCQHLFEDPEKDLKTVRYAQRAVGKILRFLTDKTENTPLKDCGFDHVTASKDELWMFPVTDAGLPHQNVRFAVGWRMAADTKRKTKAFVVTAQDGPKQFILLVALLDHNPENDTDIAYKLDFSDVVHEFIHVLDYRRGYLTHKDNIKRAERLSGTKREPTQEQYFNSPIEFNGYYQQGLSKVLNSLVIASYKLKQSPTYAYAYRVQTLKSFNAFLREHRYSFNDSWMHMLTPENKKRFMRRFYRLYELVRDRWPNMEAIRDMAAESEEAAKRS